MDIQTRVAQVLGAVADLLPAGTVSAVRELLDAGESGVGLEVLCAQLAEYDRKVTFEVFTELAVLFRRMALDDSGWMQLDRQSPSRSELLELVRKVMEVDGDEELLDCWSDVIERVVAHPAWKELAYYSQPELTPEEVVDEVMSYTPIALRGRGD